MLELDINQIAASRNTFRWERTCQQITQELKRNLGASTALSLAFRMPKLVQIAASRIAFRANPRLRRLR